jgi:hypothetical protein
MKVVIVESLTDYKREVSIGLSSELSILSTNRICALIPPPIRTRHALEVRWTYFGSDIESHTPVITPFESMKNVSRPVPGGAYQQELHNHRRGYGELRKWS